MSIHLASMVWKTELGSANVKAVAMKLADCANDDGRNIWPSVATIARETELSIRTVQMMLRKLEGMGILKVAERGGSCPGHTTVYEIDLTVLAALRAETAARWKAADVAMGAKSAPMLKRRLMGANRAKRGAAGHPTLQLEPSIKSVTMIWVVKCC